MPWRTERRTLRAAMTGGGQRLAGRAARALFGCAALAGSFASAAHAAVLPTGRPVAPAGHVTALQSFPTGAAVNPNGQTVLAIAGPVIQGGAPAGPNEIGRASWRERLSIAGDAGRVTVTRQ